MRAAGGDGLMSTAGLNTARENGVERETLRDEKTKERGGGREDEEECVMQGERCGRSGEAESRDKKGEKEKQKSVIQRLNRVRENGVERETLAMRQRKRGREGEKESVMLSERCGTRRV